MKKFNWIALLALASALTVNAHAAPERVGDFTLLDHKGNAHQLTRYGFNDLLVFISQVDGCEANVDNITRYKVLRTNYNHRNVGFFMINPNDSRDTIRQTDEIWNFDFPILIDRTQLVADNMGITHGNQIVVVDPTRRNIIYRGPIDVPAQGELRNLLNEVLDNNIDTRTLDTKVVEMNGDPSCEITYPVAERHQASVPDYETEVAPILIEYCVGCHIDGGIGPFAMNSHQMVQGWSPMIREVVMTGRMPPMQVDPDIREWFNAGNMPIEDTQKLIHWIDAGAPR